MEVKSNQIKPLEKNNLNRPEKHLEHYACREDGNLFVPPENVESALNKLMGWMDTCSGPIWGDLFNIALVVCGFRPACLIEEDPDTSYGLLKCIAQDLSSIVKLRLVEEKQEMDRNVLKEENEEERRTKRFLFLLGPLYDEMKLNKPIDGLNYHDPFPWIENGSHLNSKVNMRKNVMRWTLFPQGCEIYCEVSRSVPSSEWMENKLRPFQSLATWMRNKRLDDVRFINLKLVCSISNNPSMREIVRYLVARINKNIDEKNQIFESEDIVLIRNVYYNFIYHGTRHEDLIFETLLETHCMTIEDQVEILKAIKQGVID